MDQPTRHRVLDIEHRLRDRFRHARFVIETNPTSEEIAEAIELFGVVMLARRRDLEQAVLECAGITAMALVGHALTSYERGAFWESFCRRRTFREKALPARERARRRRNPRHGDVPGTQRLSKSGVFFAEDDPPRFS
ncbi:hypothetical protein [Gordonia crocea]|uniref:Uncharacterized protein n=1 Tax=Gordonia crocea TaxID=589162 RepID=A0A7M4BQ60_9ACTN|nr:hypothetical protein [Gordonia crocea]GED96021.1 hypothetical protein nbrc107697_00600 [Gordonia crocea]